MRSQRGLGIVTQTSLLRVFDPIEMYSIIEGLQRTLHQIGDGSSSASNLQAASKTEDLITDLLFDIEVKLLRLLDEGGVERQQRLVQGALKSLQQVQTRLGS